MNRYPYSEYYCPFCLEQLKVVPESDYLFCDNNLLTCHYTNKHQSKSPLTHREAQVALKLRYLQQLRSVEKQLRLFQKKLNSLNKKIKSLDLLEANTQ